MILSTSATKPSLSRKGKTTLFYSILSIFFFIFSRIYESLSYGEVSAFMHYLFLVPLIGGAILLAALFVQPQLSRLTYNLWNSGVAILSAGFLLRGIINLSGRSTTLDQPYWLIGCLFLICAVCVFLKTPAQRRRRTRT